MHNYSVVYVVEVVLVTAAVGVGVAVGASVAYLSTRVMYSTRVAQQISQLHNNIVEMKQNLAVIEQGMLNLRMVTLFL